MELNEKTPLFLNGEFEWKLRWHHRKWMERMGGKGYHHPQAHHNPFAVSCPPPLRGDGKTYCDKCHLAMLDFDKLDKGLQAMHSQAVQDAADCHEAFVDYFNSGKKKR